jgi:hypothetical protein
MASNKDLNKIVVKSPTERTYLTNGMIDGITYDIDNIIVSLYGQRFSADSSLTYL